MKTLHYFLGILLIVFISCSEEDDKITYTAKDPTAAEKATIDRFSDNAGTLMQRSSNSDLPGENEPINFDAAPFITKSLGPDGQKVEYYNFDVQPLTPAPIYVLFKEGEEDPVSGQLNIINVIPGDEGYNDFWLMTKVTVPNDYVANAYTSYQDLVDANLTIEPTTTLVNCPVVPEGSTASKRYGTESSNLHQGWYKGKIAVYFTFEEKALSTTQTGTVPLSPIYVTFNINPDDMDSNSGPPSGFVTETGTEQTHNVIATIPTDDTYSPLWIVNVFDNADFENVSNLSTAEAANILAEGVMNVNCPVVFVE